MSSDTGVMKWKTKGRTFSFDEGPLIMAILNTTPDSFSDGGKFGDPYAALTKAEQFVSEGADIIDIGGESTRPNAARVSPEDELRRVGPVIEAIARRFGIAISVDTTKAAVAQEALNSGADIINDISGLRFDSDMAKVARNGEAGVVLMHVRGTFETMHEKTIEGDIVDEVAEGFLWSLQTAKNTGISEDRICLDVGIGFGKTQSQNLRLLGRLSELTAMFPAYPMLVGVSRKSFIGKIIGEPEPARRLAGSIAANCTAVAAGAKILRVHDVKETVDAVKVLSAIRNEI